MYSVHKHDIIERNIIIIIIFSLLLLLLSHFRYYSSATQHLYLERKSTYLLSIHNMFSSIFFKIKDSTKTELLSSAHEYYWRILLYDFFALFLRALE